MDEQTFVSTVVNKAKSHGYIVEYSRNGIQIDFGNKKLHEGHLRKLYPQILSSLDISSTIERIAPGRPCTHKPMREIIEEMKREQIRR